MPARRKTGSHRKAAADREFETLLLRAAYYQGTQAAARRRAYPEERPRRIACSAGSCGAQVRPESDQTPGHNTRTASTSSAAL
jgi:hypothetical protein